ncbi:MAG TPA: translation elongation factor Ts [Thermomicrobiales bacterium]|jgi:elongation factor Ts
MAKIGAAEVKKLREATGAGVIECRNALAETGGDQAKATELLRQRGIAKAGKKSDRVANQGLVEAYIHGGRVGAMVEINCETDFVARNETFRTLAREIAMQVASMNPRYVSAEERPAEFTASDPDHQALLDQDYIRDSKRTIGDMVKEAIATLGENIVVRRFTRFELGKSDAATNEVETDEATAVS